MAGERSYFPAVNDILTPIDMARNYYAQQINNEVRRSMAMNEQPSATPTPVPQSYFPAATNLGISSFQLQAKPQNIPNFGLDQSGRFMRIPYSGSPSVDLSLYNKPPPHETRYFRQYSVDQLATPPRNLYDKTPAVLGSYESYRL